ncbi:hypothetical protein PR202_gb17693 [Eleusine coracana subsp. coracana]|uniref:KIB1-4 beta-propeller domain-containing protein n=1 Tax=Eleusine coracana subsp. coracana TaxID=191504 RepID=A0AAV5F499_ELECO|nr:hypothetical protein QOZ80_6BG0463290 [Eleusine coracana subsp. coracana]GJN29467.1 hypothetical protein PR202_gb17693 [Eleusine coracana subsp. coracana]
MVAGDWSSLPADLLSQVSCRPSSDGDLLRIHLVCTHWRAFTSPPAIYRPWVIGIRPSRAVGALSNTEILLPCLNPITIVFLSDDPDWVAIAAQLQGIIGQTTLLWRPGYTAWTMMNGRGTSRVESVTFLGGKAYYMDIRTNNIIY